MYSNNNSINKRSIFPPGKFIIVFGLGFFTISVQTLLFRDFLYVYEGTELAVGLFFFSWLLWVGAGAFIGKIIKTSSSFLQKYFELAILIYIPVYVFEYGIIYNARSLCGISPHELFPFFSMVPVTLLALAPVSLCTGIFFTNACTWMTCPQPDCGSLKTAKPEKQTGIHTSGLAVALVYIAEVSGGCGGGLYVTLTLSLGIPQESVFLVTAMLLSLSVLFYRLVFIKKHTIHTGILCVIVILTMAGVVGNGFTRFWTTGIRKDMWSRLLPAKDYMGSFTTSGALYNYGEYNGVFTVISWGTVCEQYPDTLYGNSIAALHIAQNPGIGKILVIGYGALPVCRGFFRFPEVKEVVWAAPDPSYPEKVMKVLPAVFKEEFKRLTILKGDIHQHIMQYSHNYDLVLLHLPDPTTLVLNNFFTREFYIKLKQNMAKDGLLSVQTPGGENFLGSELISIGASVFETLKRVFNKVIIKPGEQSWLIASDDERLTDSLEILKERYTKIESAEAVYPVQGLELQYQEDRTVFQREKYEEILNDAGSAYLINTESMPKAMFHSLVFSLKMAGAVVLNPRITRFLVQYGLYSVLGGLLFFCLLRILYQLRAVRPEEYHIACSSEIKPGFGFNNLFLIFSNGLTGISISIILIFFYQLRFGSLYLHIGVISALFMLGLCAGGACVRRIFLNRNKELTYLLPVLLLLNILLLVIIYMFHAAWNQCIHILLFFICGVTGGTYIPLIAFRLKQKAIPDKHAGAAIELSDHLGAALGGLVTGVIFIPILGAYSSIVILAVLLGVNILMYFFFQSPETGKIKKLKSDHAVRIAGYCAGGIGVFLFINMLIFNGIVYFGSGPDFSETARMLAKDIPLLEKSTLSANDHRIPYYVVKDDILEETQYIFSTKYLAPGISGYGGPMELAVFLSESGRLINYTVMESFETPIYLDYVSKILQPRLIGKNLFDEDLTSQVDGVTGATMTSDALIRIVSRGGMEFARIVLDKGVGKDIPLRTIQFSQVLGFIILFIFIVLCVVARQYPLLWGRRIFLCSIVIVCGVILNIQYSTDHIFRLGLIPFTGFSAGTIIILVAGIPIISMLFGNIYCGYLCPFGALQELIGDFKPGRLKTGPDKNKTLSVSKYFKYLLLLFLALSSAGAMNPSIFIFDPLIGFFRFYGDIIVILFCIFILVLSFFYIRIWCRNLCPVGAFLSLVGSIKLLRFLIPKTVPRYCDLGVRKYTDLDCICCDRCRIKQYQKREIRDGGHEKMKEGAFLFIILILIMMLLAGQIVYNSKAGVSEDPGVVSTGEITIDGIEGKARDLDIKLINDLIKKGYLSDEEAEFYKKFELGDE